MIGNTLMLRDLARMAGEGIPQLNARVSQDPNLISEAEFQIQNGMSKAAYAERQRIWARDAYEQEITADLDGDPPSIPVPAGLSAKRKMYFRFHAWLVSEEKKLAALEAKRAELQSIIAEPVSTEGALHQMVRRTADSLLGRGKDESDATAWASLESKRIEQQHRAAAARLAIEDLEGEIEKGGLRVARLREREPEFLYVALYELAEGMKKLLARKEAECRALKRTLDPLYDDYRYYHQNAESPDPPRVELSWRFGWHDVATKLQSEPGADVTKMLPPIKFQDSTA